MATKEEPPAPPTIKLYIVRVSPPCRVVWLYLLQHNIPHTVVDVDLTKATSDLPEVIQGSPHLEVPILVHGDLVLFEAPVILQYIGREFTSHVGFGHGQQARLQSEALVSWACGELHRCIGYNYVYPQFLDSYALPEAAANEALVEFGLRRVTSLLETLEKRYLDRTPYLTGQRATIADACVASVVSQLEWANFSFKLWPNVQLWMHRVKHVDFWDTVHQAHADFVAELSRSRYKFE